MRYLSATEIPPAGAPPGGRGSLCGNGWLSRSPLNPVCRFAQDDTEGEPDGETKNKMPYQLV